LADASASSEPATMDALYAMPLHGRTYAGVSINVLAGLAMRVATRIDIAGKWREK